MARDRSRDAKVNHRLNASQRANVNQDAVASYCKDVNRMNNASLKKQFAIQKR